MACYLRLHPPRSISNTTDILPLLTPFMAYQAALMTASDYADRLTIAREYYEKQMVSEHRQQAEMAERGQRRPAKKRE
jgi:hypothetical protein